MKCDHCDQTATVHVTHVVNGKVMKAHLCEECAQKMGVSAPGVLSVSQALLGLTPEQAPLSPRACSVCGMTLRRFQKEGRLGCPSCYQAFAKDVEVVLQSLHGSVTHAGRRPPSEPGVRPARPLPQLHQLQERLTRAIADEDYEDAARLRDEIRLLQEGGDPGEEVEHDLG